MIRGQLIWFGAAAAGLGALVLWQFGPFTDHREPSMLQPDDPALVADGGKIYRANCASCHGVDLQGQPDWRRPGADGRMPAPPHDQTGHTWHHTDAVLFGLTKYGVVKFAGLKDYDTAMPTYEDILPDDDIVAVLSFIKAQWPLDIRKRHDAMNAQSTAADQ